MTSAVRRELVRGPRALYQQLLLKKRGDFWYPATRSIDVVSKQTLHTLVDPEIASEVQWPELPKELELIRQMDAAMKHQGQRS